MCETNGRDPITVSIDSLILRFSQDARTRFARLCSDVLLKLELLGNKHVQHVVWQLHNLVARLADFRRDTQFAARDLALPDII
jgi:hypothetical protein